ncbi:MAG: tetratricopeptide repeat protein [Xanthomonadales bacterium]|nr:tetratricopeptide repeat protein [Xanthomonadales bacterium]
MNSHWQDLARRKDEDINLLDAALLIARDEYPDLDPASYTALCEQWRRQVAPQIERAGNQVDALQALNRFLYEEQGLAGNDDDFYDPRNNYINQVLERRLGIPITLGLLQIDLASRLGLGIEGIAFPGHFLIRMPVQGGLMVLDPFQRGRSLDVGELRQRAQPHMAPDQDLGDQQLFKLLDAASHRSILTRMLRNLRSVYLDKNDLERALRCADRLLTIDPGQAMEYRERARLYQALEYFPGVVRDLDRYLAMAPDADDANVVRNALIQAQGRLGRTRLH